MLDYISSQAAYREYEERVHAHVPALDYDGWTRDQRTGQLSGQVGRLLSTLGGTLLSLGARLKHEPERSSVPS